MRNSVALALVAMLLAGTTPALAQDVAAASVDTGDTAWILTSSALVLLMTMPGLALFYGGLVRAKNFLSVLVQVGAIAAIASTLWIIAGYTLAFGEVTNGWLGAGNAWMLVGTEQLMRGELTISERTFALFQLTFAAITPALMAGAWVDRPGSDGWLDFAPCGASRSMRLSHTGCGAMAGWPPRSARSTLLAGLWSIPRPGFPRWSRRCCWVAAKVFPRP